MRISVILKKIRRSPGKIPKNVLYKLPFITKRMSAEKHLKIIFRCAMGKRLDLEHPKTFNEKLQWLKLNDKNPAYPQMVDKYAAKEFAADKIGREYIIPTLGVWDSFDEIDPDKLPNEFVLKTTHDSGGVVICRDKAQFDRKAAKKKLSASLKKNFYYMGREWPYKEIPPRIIGEKLMKESEDSDAAPVDYKFFCFDGKADCVMICIGRETGETKFYFFDKDWNLKRYNLRGKEAPADFTVPKPPKMDEMFVLAEKLSQGIPFVRVDLYCIQEQIYFGEMTFYPDSGFDNRLLPETDAYFGDLIKLDLKG